MSKRKDSDSISDLTDQSFDSSNKEKMREFINSIKRIEKLEDLPDFLHSGFYKLLQSGSRVIAKGSLVYLSEESKKLREVPDFDTVVLMAGAHYYYNYYLHHFPNNALELFLREYLPFVDVKSKVLVKNEKNIFFINISDSSGLNIVIYDYHRLDLMPKRSSSWLTSHDFHIEFDVYGKANIIPNYSVVQYIKDMRSCGFYLPEGSFFVNPDTSHLILRMSMLYAVKHITFSAIESSLPAISMDSIYLNNMGRTIREATNPILSLAKDCRISLFERTENISKSFQKKLNDFIGSHNLSGDVIVNFLGVLQDILFLDSRDYSPNHGPDDSYEYSDREIELRDIFVGVIIKKYQELKPNLVKKDEHYILKKEIIKGSVELLSKREARVKTLANIKEGLEIRARDKEILRQIEEEKNIRKAEEERLIKEKKLAKERENLSRIKAGIRKKALENYEQLKKDAENRKKIREEKAFKKAEEERIIQEKKVEEKRIIQDQKIEEKRMQDIARKQRQALKKMEEKKQKEAKRLSQNNKKDELKKSSIKEEIFPPIAHEVYLSFEKRKEYSNLKSLFYDLMQKSKEELVEMEEEVINYINKNRDFINFYDASSGNSFLHSACLITSLKIVKVLLEINPNLLNFKNKDGLNPLSYLCLHSRIGFDGVGILKYFLNIKGEYSQRDVYYNNSLMFLIKNRGSGIAEIVEMARNLVSFLDLSSMNNNKGNNALIESCLYDHNDKITDLILGVENIRKFINNKGELGYTALHCCVSNGKKESTIKLLNKGANVNVKNHNGLTPLIMAAGSILSDHDSVVMSDILVKKGADIYMKDNNGRNAICYALEKNKSNLAVYLNSMMSLNENTIEEKKISKYINEYDQSRKLLERDRSIVNITNQHGQSLMIILLNRFKVREKTVDEVLEFIDLFAEFGFNFFMKDADGNTIMHCACSLGNTEIVEKVAQYSREIDERNRFGHTPLDVLACFKFAYQNFEDYENSVDIISSRIEQDGQKQGEVIIVRESEKLEKISIEKKSSVENSGRK